MEKLFDDLATLSELDENLILKQLRGRYAEDRVYTYVGDILIAVNPFKPLQIYSKQVSKQYRKAQKKDNPPHIFAIADIAYQSLQGIGGKIPQNQCCVISGESGAGKTESAKLLIRQLVDLSGGQSELDQQILQVNPLLEAFGNARTLMNDNSSRFGKYIQLKFQDGKVVGAKISEYLLEKSRLVHQNQGEQNFHVFYYLFPGLQKDKLTKLCLSASDPYRYMSGGLRSSATNNAKFQKEFDNVVNAMDIVGFLEQEQKDMLKILATILNLGNITFTTDENDNTCVKGKTYLNNAAGLLGIEPPKLSDVLTSFVTVTRGSQIKRRYTQQQANNARDAMAKALYGRLFSWIVNKVNRLVAPEFIMDPEKPHEIALKMEVFLSSASCKLVNYAKDVRQREVWHLCNFYDDLISFCVS